jgi:hypothetical protein
MHQILSSWNCNFRDYAEPPPANLIFIASMLHDIGVSSEHNGEQRFEVEGADAAVKLMQAYDANKENMSEVWEAIALHTSPGIAERISPLALCVRIGVKIDFARESRYEEKQGLEVFCAEVEKIFPRLDIEKVLGDAVVTQAVGNPAKAPKASWPWCLLVAHHENPNYEGVNPGF